MTNNETAIMFTQAATEIENLRRQRDMLAAQMEVVEVFRAALLGPPRSQGASPDIAWQLRKEAEILRSVDRTPTEGEK